MNRDRRAEELAREVERRRGELAATFEAFGRSVSSSLNPLESLRKAPIATALASVAAGLAIGALLGPNGRRRGGEGERDGHSALAHVTHEALAALIPAVIPAVVPALLALLTRRDRR